METKEYTQKQLEEMANDYNSYYNEKNRVKAAEQGYALEKLVDDESVWVREEVAKAAGKLGREDLLDKLVNDESYCVREAVAEQGYGLDRLVDDEHYWVRVIVVIQASKLGKTDLLEKLSKDKNYEVRTAVAKQGYALDKLVKDRSMQVREVAIEVAISQKYKLDNLDKLADNKNEDVLEFVLKQALELGREDLLERLADNKNSNHSICIDIIVQAKILNKPNWLDKLTNNNDPYVRAAVAEQGYALDKLVDDEDYRVREAVAEQGYALEKLVNDEAGCVLEVVLEQALELGRTDLLGKLANNKNSNYLTCVEIIKQAEELNKPSWLNKFVNNENWDVRRKTAEIAGEIKKRSILAQLADDEDEYVREEVAKAAIINNYTSIIMKLVSDKDERVRKTILEEKYRLNNTVDTKLLNKFLNDKNCTVRAKVAEIAGETKNKNILRKLSDDENWRVREEVARQAGEIQYVSLLKKLFNDENEDVQDEIRYQNLHSDRKLINKVKKAGLETYHPQGQWNGFGYTQLPLCVELTTIKELEKFYKLKKEVVAEREAEVQKEQERENKLNKLELNEQNVATALYSVNKEAKRQRDIKNEAIECAYGDNYYDDTSHYYPNVHNVLHNAKDKMNYLYDLKDKALRTAIRKWNLKPVGYHKFADMNRDMYEFGEHQFHINEKISEKDLGTIEEEISADRKRSFPPEKAQKLLKRFIEENAA